MVTKMDAVTRSTRGNSHTTACQGCSGVKGHICRLTFMFGGFVLSVQTVHLSVAQRVSVHTHAALTVETVVPAPWQPHTRRREQEVTFRVKGRFLPTLTAHLVAAVAAVVDAVAGVGEGHALVVDAQEAVFAWNTWEQ